VSTTKGALVLSFSLAVALVGIVIATPVHASGLLFTNTTTTNGLGNNGVRGVQAVGSTVYAATNGGLSISTDGGATFTNRTTANGLVNNIVNGVFAVGSSVYAATSGGLSITTDGGATFTNRTTANGLVNNIVNGVFAVGSSVYAATSGGLSITTDGGASFTNYTTTDGLGNNIVYGMYVVGSTAYAATAGGLSISGAIGPATDDQSSGPPPILQQFGKPASGTCNDAASPSLNWSGVPSDGWAESWAQWPNGGNGGFVCTRTLIYSTTQAKWIVG
jgi:hypothetical protein